MSGIEKRRRCKLCGERKDHHAFGKCKDGQEYVTCNHGRKSMSFHAGERDVLKQLCVNATERRDSGYLARNLSFASLMRKAIKLAEKETT